MVNETAKVQRHLLEDAVGRNPNLIQVLDPFMNPSKLSFRVAKMNYEAEK